MPKMVVLGAGVMGSAFAQLLADTGNEVCLVGTHLDREIIDSLRTDGTHPGLKVRLPDKVAAYFNRQLEQVLDEQVRLIVFGVNSAGVDWAVTRIGSLLKSPVPIIMVTKGLAIRNRKFEILPQVVEDALAEKGIGGAKVAAVGGPCIAGEMAVRRPTSVVIASKNLDLLDWLLDLVDAPYYHARKSSDLVGVEVCAALKNFYTLAVGYAAGQLELIGRAPNGALMHNLAAGLFTQALAEMRYFTQMLGGQSPSVSGLAGAGDLYVTCQAGRNGRMGKLLGSGLLYRQAKAEHMPEDTIEGAELALVIGNTLRQLAADRTVDDQAVPLALRIVDAICDNQPLQIPWDRFYR